MANLDELERSIDSLEVSLKGFIEQHWRYKAFTRLGLRVADEMTFEPDGSGVRVSDDAAELCAEFVDQAGGIDIEEQTDPPRKREFEELKRKWVEETGHMSASRDRFMNEHYQRIIGMGRAALPLIFRDMLNNDDVAGHWHWALRAITGHDPVRSDHEGDVEAIREDWLQYAREMGFIDKDT